VAGEEPSEGMSEVNKPFYYTKIYKQRLAVYFMPHQCVHCSKVYPNAAKELLEGCECGSHFFFYIREEQLKKAMDQPVIELTSEEKEKVEHDVREMMGVEDEEIPVILDLEAVHVLGPGKFEIDLVRLFDTKRPLVYKLEEGKYIIDLASTFMSDMKDKKEIK